MSPPIAPGKEPWPSPTASVCVSEWTTEKALAIGTYFAASGLPVHLGLMPPIKGSDAVLNILIDGMKSLFGGYFFVEDNPIEAADQLEAIIMERRTNLHAMGLEGDRHHSMQVSNEGDSTENIRKGTRTGRPVEDERFF